MSTSVCVCMHIHADLLLLQEQLVSILFGMLRQHKLNFVDVYREEAFTALKAIVKQVC